MPAPFTATGRPVDLPLAIFINLENGLLAGERFYWDLTTLLKQMGLEKLPVKPERAIKLAS